jgi:hypothetical protein
MTIEQTTVDGVKAQAMADKFSEVLRGWLTPEEMAAVIERNRTEEHPSVCHSHDFCDANEAMAEAFQALMGRDVLLIGDIDTAGLEAVNADSDLWGAAWDLAKRNEFKAAL